jgi:hypothetical protein
MPTAIDLKRLGMSYGDLEALATSAKVEDRISAGLIGGHVDPLGDEVLKQFKVEDAMLLTKTVSMPVVAAGGSVPIIPSLEPPKGYVYTLLGVGVDAQTIRGLALLNDTFVKIKRSDISQPQLIKLDCAAMPGATAGTVSDMMRMYINTADGNGSIEVNLESITGIVAGFDVKVMYGIRKINYVDRFLWSNMIKTKDAGITAKQTQLEADYKISQSALIGA